MRECGLVGVCSFCFCSAQTLPLHSLKQRPGKVAGVCQAATEDVATEGEVRRDSNEEGGPHGGLQRCE